MDFFANIFEDMPDNDSEYGELVTSLLGEGADADAIRTPPFFAESAEVPTKLPKKKAVKEGKSKDALLAEFLSQADTDIRMTPTPYSPQTSPAAATQANKAADTLYLDRLWLQRIAGFMKA